MSRATRAHASQPCPDREAMPLGHPAKAIYFATGSPGLAIQDLTRLGLTGNGIALRVVSPLSGARELSTHPALRKTTVLSYTPSRALWLWLQLLAFLGFTRNVELICLNTPRSYRLLKLLAFSLRGRGRFSSGEQQTPELTVLGMIRLSWHNFWIRREKRIKSLPILFIGSGSARSLQQIVSGVRLRYPHERFVAWLPEELAAQASRLFDEVRVVRPGVRNYLATILAMARSSRRFQGCVIACTNEFQRWMKIPATLLPFRGREFYNEVGDGFRLEEWRSGLRHLSWRFLQSDRKAAWPIAVIGSASGFYLEKIVATLRRSFPGSEIHGWLGPLQAASAGHLFDVVHGLPTTRLSPESCARLLRRGRRYRDWIIPCTDEPFGWLKLMALALPLPCRRLYNETGDGFPLRQVSTVWRHIFWRLRYKFTFQFLAVSPQSTFLHRLLHVPAYALRLAAAVPLLARATRRRPEPRPVHTTVELLAAPSPESQVALSRALKDPGQITLTVRGLRADRDVYQQLSSAARDSRAEFLCLLDGLCEINSHGWLETLLESFDDSVAQAGPELFRTGRNDLCQGAFFDASGVLQWNTGSAARYHRKQQYLEVGALPWVCLLIRREAFLAVAPEIHRRGGGSEWVLAELSHQFAVNGWISICNTDVSISHPLKARAEHYHLSTAL